VDNSTLQKLNKVNDELHKQAAALQGIKNKFAGDPHGEIVAALELIEQAQTRIENVIDVN
jgi:hypothetical protein